MFTIQMTLLWEEKFQDLYEKAKGFKRAGADAIISYATLDALKIISEQQ